MTKLRAALDASTELDDSVDPNPEVETAVYHSPTLVSITVSWDPEPDPIEGGEGSQVTVQEVGPNNFIASGTIEVPDGYEGTLTLTYNYTNTD